MAKTTDTNALGKIEKLRQNSFCVKKKLSPNEFLIENKLLMKRQKKIETGVSAKNLGLRHLVLYHYDEESGNWKKVESNCYLLLST